MERTALIKKLTTERCSSECGNCLRCAAAEAVARAQALEEERDVLQNIADGRRDQLAEHTASLATERARAEAAELRAERAEAALKVIAEPAMWSIGHGATIQTPSGLCEFANNAINSGGS